MPHTNLTYAFSFLEQLVRRRLEQELKNEGRPSEPAPMPSFSEDDGSPFTYFLHNYRPTRDELATLLMALAPNVYPHFFDALISEYLPKGGEFPAIGGIKGKNHRGTIPTGETVLFLLAGNDLNRRFEVQQLFSAGHFFEREKILYLEDMKPGEPPMSGRLILDPDYTELFTIGRIPIPRLTTNFPALHLTTELEWDDLVLNDYTASQIRELEHWVQYNDTLMYNWGMYKKLKPGYRALFYGPPGTGKTFTASLLGKYTGREVFKIDLSMVISKYIGETEKNLATLFDKAQNKDWILFFDEADAIFGKRTNVRDAHDKYANQEVSYLLQRIELYPGLAILASNFKSNIDEAFIRRFNSIIYFPVPAMPERLRIWQKAFPGNVAFAEDVEFRRFAQQHELTGSHIMNIVQTTCLEALSRNTHTITSDMIRAAIQKELSKEEKIGR